MSNTKKGAKALASMPSQEVEIVGKTPPHIADQHARLVAIDDEVKAVLGGAYTHEEMAIRGAQATRGSVALDIIAGVHFAMLRKSAGHGAYLKQLELVGVHERTARRKVAYAYAVLGSDLSRWSRVSLASLGPAKIKSLEDFSEDELDQLAAGDEVQGVTLDKIQRMSNAELQKALRAAEKKLEAVKAAHDEDAAAAAELRRENQRLRRQWSASPLDERIAERCTDLEHQVSAIEAQLGDYGGDGVTRGLAGAVEALLDECDKSDPTQRRRVEVQIQAQINRLLLAVRALHDEYVALPLGGEGGA